MKAWLATCAAALVLVQLTSALWMYGKLPLRPAGAATHGDGPPLERDAWRSCSPCRSRTTACGLSGFAETGARQIAHSIFGCAFYGAFATKMLVLRIDGLPRLVLPLCGGLLVTLLTGLWLDVVAVVLHQRRVPVLTVT